MTDRMMLFVEGSRPNSVSGVEELGLELVDYLERNPSRADVDALLDAELVEPEANGVRILEVLP